MFKKLKEDLAPEFPGLRPLRPTRWTIHGGSLQNVINNCNVLQELWDECLKTKLEPDIKRCIVRVKHQVVTFDYFFGVNLGGMLLKHSNNLSRTIETLHMPVAECQLVVALTTKALTKVRTEETFSLFWERCNEATTELKINEPVLPRKGQCFLVEAPSEFHDNVKHYYRQIYFQLIGAAVNFIKSRFEQKDYVNCYPKVESTLLLAAKGETFDEHILAICFFYGDNLEQQNLHTQLTLLGTLFDDLNKDSIDIPLVINQLRELPQPQKNLFS